MTERALLLSDVHLSDERPAQVQRFLDTLAGPARAAGQLFILGDLFEYWVGDDDRTSSLANTVMQAIAALARTGCAVALTHGNRDFLIGEAFAAQAGIRLLDDPVCLPVGGQDTILMHGDLLCTDDTGYLAFRSQVRQPAWQVQFLAQPIEVRHGIARGATAESGRAKAAKSEDIMDVTEQAVVEVFRRFACDRLIHGHTHRPGHHVHTVDGHPCQRWVLPDWYQTGGYLLAQGDRVEAVHFSA